MNALEKAVKALKDKEKKQKSQKKVDKAKEAETNSNYNRLFFTKNFPMLMNGDATIHTKIELDSLYFEYRGKELNIAAIGNPEIWVIRGVTREQGMQRYDFYPPYIQPMQDQLIKILKEYF